MNKITRHLFKRYILFSADQAADINAPTVYKTFLIEKDVFYLSDCYKNKKRFIERKDVNIYLYNIFPEIDSLNLFLSKKIDIKTTFISIPTYPDYTIYYDNYYLSFRDDMFLLLLDLNSPFTSRQDKKICAIQYKNKTTIYQALEPYDIDYDSFSKLEYKVVSYRPKMSQTHHYHLLDDFLTSTFVDQLKFNKRKYYILLCHASNLEDANVAFIEGLILFLNSIDYSFSKILSQLLTASTVYEWYSIAKEITVRIKALYHENFKKYIQLFELETLVNRVMTPVDFVSDIDNRTTKTNTTHVSDETVYNYAFELLRKGRDRCQNVKYKRKNYKNFKDFLLKRFEWCTSGNGFIQGEKNEYTKKIEILDSYTLEQLLDKLVQVENMYVHPSIKNEWGKSRAIYSTDVLTYPLFEYIFSDCENVLPPTATIGKFSSDNEVDSFIYGILNEDYILTVDFEDFNSQHSLGTIKSIMSAWYNVWKDDMPRDSYIIFLKCMSLIDNTIIKHNDSSYKVNATLMSGWRLTTFINTVANYVYHRAILDEAKLKYRYSYHAGDDMITSLKNISCFDNYLKAAEKLNIRLQLSKTNICSVIEFLRKEYTTSQPTQYLARAIASLVHGRIESRDTNNLQQALLANNTRYNEYIKRGGLEFDTYTYMNAKFEKKFDKEIIEAMLYVPILQGGTKEIKHIDELTPYEIIHTPSHVSMIKHKHYSLKDYVKVLSHEAKKKSKGYIDEDNEQHFSQKVYHLFSDSFDRDVNHFTYRYHVEHANLDGFRYLYQIQGIYKDEREISQKYYYSRKIPKAYQEVFLDNNIRYSLEILEKYFPNRAHKFIGYLF